jgi:copper chaperone
MATKKFKTNIKCSVCVGKVTPFLDEAVGKDQWSVDLTSPDRTLTVDVDVQPNNVQEAVNKAGYKAESV